MRWGFFIFLSVALFGDFIANEKPLYCELDGVSFFPAFRQKAIDWHLAQPDSILVHTNWQQINATSSVKAPIPFSATTIDVNNGQFKPPFQAPHWLGTDSIGRDTAAGLVAGAQIAFYIGLGATLLALFIGVLLGAIAGYFGKWADVIIMRGIEIKKTIPSVFWIISLAAIMNQCNVVQLIIIIGVLAWTNLALLTRAAVMKNKVADYAMAAKTIGLSDMAILWKHILPNSMGAVKIAAASIVVNAIITETSLTFLGIGLPIETVTWGAMIRQSQQNINAWWLTVFPGLCLFLVIRLVYLLGSKTK